VAAFNFNLKIRNQQVILSKVEVSKSQNTSAKTPVFCGQEMDTGADTLIPTQACTGP
jgi:hypothetical protein